MRVVDLGVGSGGGGKKRKRKEEEEVEGGEMGVDYYSVLKVLRMVIVDDLKRVYWKLVMRWYFDKNLNSKKEVEVKFK